MLVIKFKRIHSASKFGFRFEEKTEVQMNHLIEACELPRSIRAPTSGAKASIACYDSIRILNRVAVSDRYEGDHRSTP